MSPSVRALEREELVSDNFVVGQKSRSLDEGPSRPGTSAANDFVDDILKNLPKFDARIDPAQLGDLTKGGVHLANITLTGISDAYRYDNAHLNITEDSLHIITKLGSPKLAFRGRYRYKLPWLLPNVNGDFRLALNRIVILFDIGLTPDGARLNQLEVANLHSIRFDELSGLSPFNWALRYLLEAVFRLNKKPLIHTLQEQSRTYLLKAMDSTTGAADAINEIEKEMIDANRAEDYPVNDLS
ncbi:uncharacterized protein LOC108863853 [Galendromus occidentalis]|uniref:Uncharacterized protein LOC108863853 n=1 Tax=Galendromus occidentalis TaxID=34638 RepID=A0AAJ7L4X3_9ACAR|nr:uncharacterized protein LOC108863853 [Galendromus occidentalis]